MRFAWDASKSERNLAERGFAFAPLVFDGPTLERPDIPAPASDFRPPSP